MTKKKTKQPPPKPPPSLLASSTALDVAIAPLLHESTNGTVCKLKVRACELKGSDGENYRINRFERTQDIPLTPMMRSVALIHRLAERILSDYIDGELP